MQNASSGMKRWAFLFRLFYKKAVTRGVETHGKGSSGRLLLCTCGGAHATLGLWEEPWGRAAALEMRTEDSWPVLRSDLVPSCLRLTRAE